MVFDLAHGRIHRARVEAVYPSIADGTVTLVHSDGPYNLGKAAWDKVPDLAAFYRPHIAAWSRICAPSASVYLWGTAEGWATVHPEMVAAGWGFASLIVWRKAGAQGSLIGAATSRAWPLITGVAGYYRRGQPHHKNPPNVTNVWDSDPSNDMRRGERLYGDDVNEWPDGYQSRAPVHPCQKPLMFAERIVLASSRPGDLVLDPFGGTCRIAVANERIARHDPAEARRTLTVEQDEDGRDYIGAVLRSMGDDLGTPAHAAGQLRLFAGGARVR